MTDVKWAVRCKRHMAVQRPLQRPDNHVTQQWLNTVVIWLLEFYVLVISLWSYQDGHRLLTVRTHGDFIMLPYWKVKPHYPDIEPISHCPQVMVLAAWFPSGATL